MPSPGLKHATRYYLLRLWNSLVEMSGGPSTQQQQQQQQQQQSQQPDGETYVRPPDEFDHEFLDAHLQGQQLPHHPHHSSASTQQAPTYHSRDRGMRHG